MLIFNPLASGQVHDLLLLDLCKIAAIDNSRIRAYRRCLDLCRVFGAQEVWHSDVNLVETGVEAVKEDGFVRGWSSPISFS
ncbi:hypothetical protein SLEP1_g55276 [Rubroshorea leprosula]|uniref:Uncharacterized protein n=1 Tax=Rubroshorea leprosula TaxID=152421 RepID=A0AAV5MG11_9ROSI|nr:hypothetical protein SLEP1_g55276 [Rubroshorea leprosula]